MKRLIIAFYMILIIIMTVCTPAWSQRKKMTKSNEPIVNTAVIQSPTFDEKEFKALKWRNMRCTGSDLYLLYGIYRRWSVEDCRCRESLDEYLRWFF
jgi:hypothetical protein